MAKTSKNVALIALVSVCAVGVWKLGGACLDWVSADEIAAVENFENQIWLERLPEDERDMIGHLLFLETNDGNFGVVGSSSVWRHYIEIFMWQLNDDRLRVFMPQDRKRGKFKVRTWNCEDEAPEPFELCVELSRGGQSMVMFSRYDWVVEPHEGTRDAQIEKLSGAYPALAGTFSQVLHELERAPAAGPSLAASWDDASELGAGALNLATR